MDVQHKSFGEIPKLRIRIGQVRNMSAFCVTRNAKMLKFGCVNVWLCPYLTYDRYLLFDFIAMLFAKRQPSVVTTNSVIFCHNCTILRGYNIFLKCCAIFACILVRIFGRSDLGGVVVVAERGVTKQNDCLNRIDI